MNWKILQADSQIAKIVERSKEVPCLIFKHSISCPISSMAKSRLEMQWDLADQNVEVYYLDLINNRSVSNLIADTFDVRHQSPQALLIKDGICTFNTSHLDISVAGIKDALTV